MFGKEIFDNLLDVGVTTRTICPIIYRLRMHNRIWLSLCVLGPFMEATSIPFNRHILFAESSVIIIDVGISACAICEIMSWVTAAD